MSDENEETGAPEKQQRTKGNVVLGLPQHEVQRHAHFVDVQLVDQRARATNVGECAGALKPGDTEGLVDAAMGLARASVRPPEHVRTGMEFRDGKEWVRVRVVVVCGASGTGGKGRGRTNGGRNGDWGGCRGQGRHGSARDAPKRRQGVCDGVVERERRGLGGGDGGHGDSGRTGWGADDEDRVREGLVVVGSRYVSIRVELAPTQLTELRLQLAQGVAVDGPERERIDKRRAGWRSEWESQDTRADVTLWSPLG